MPRRTTTKLNTPTAFADITPLDLAYAVGRLVDDGKTTTAEVMELAAERSRRISALEADLAALKTGALPVAPAAPKVAKPTTPKRPARAPKPKAIQKASPSPAVKAPAPKAVTTVQPKPVDAPPPPAAAAVARPTPAKAPAPKATKKAPPKPQPKAGGKGGKVITRKDGRRFTMTPKAAAARKLQGVYLGFLRKVTPSEKPKFTAIAKDKGVGAAVDALKKRLGTK